VSVTVTEPPEACNAQVVAGSDTPVKKKVSMGSNPGYFDFYHVPESVPDRFIVRYPPLSSNVLFDSGCVGDSISGSYYSKTKYNLYYNAKSGNRVEVEVIPNCNNTTGTSWSFKLYCPK